MPGHMKEETLLLIGAGVMAQEYAKVLQALGITFIVVGRGDASADLFTKTTGIEVTRGGLAHYLDGTAAPRFTSAIVAVTVDQLAPVTMHLLAKGITHILAEKPVGLDEEEIAEVAKEAAKCGAHLWVAYNRRYYAPVLKAMEIISEDGGVTSFHFEFTEWSHVIEGLDLSPRIKNNWFLANSTHVVDMAFFLGGTPDTISCYTAGSIEWHPLASVFCGAGTTKKGALFSYHANWQAPGRWGVEVMTRKHRLIFRPLEKLQIQHIGSIEITDVPLENSLDVQFKPGIYRQTEDFLKREAGNLLSLEGHLENLHHYSLMLPPKQKLTNPQ